MSLRHLYAILRECDEVDGPDFDTYELPVSAILEIGNEWQIDPDPTDKHFGCSDSKHWREEFEKHGPGTMKYGGKLYVLAGDFFRYPIFWRFAKPGGPVRFDTAKEVLQHLSGFELLQVDRRTLSQKMLELEFDLIEYKGDWTVSITPDQTFFDDALDTEPGLAYGEEVLQVRYNGGMVTVAWAKAE